MRRTSCPTGSDGRRCPCGGRAALRRLLGVVKKPPLPGSAKRSIIASAVSTRRLEPALLEGRLVKDQEGLGDVGVILEVAEDLALAVLPGAQEATAWIAQAFPEEPGRRPCGRDEVGTAEHGARVGERGDREGVPRRDALVVEPRPDALRPVLVKGGSRALELCRRLGARAGRRGAGCSGPRSCPRG